MADEGVGIYSASVLTTTSRILACPGHVVRRRAVTGLAGDIDFRPGRRKGFCLRVVILLQVGGVTGGAAAVPVLARACPVQYIIMGNGFIRVEMKPALAALRSRPRIPGNAQRLQSSAG